MANSTELEQFINQLSIEISEKIGLQQPNQILTKRVIQLFQSKTGNTPTTFSKNIKSFGRFDDAYITTIWDRLTARDDLNSLSSSIDLSANPSQGLTNGLNLTGDGKRVVPQMVIQDRDLLEPSSSPAPGGLSLPTKQNGSLRVGKEDDEKHVFKAPQPARASELGLDRLAMRKRAEKLLIDERDSKKPRPENAANSEEQPEFKGCPLDQPLSGSIDVRGPMTPPSHGPGLTSTAQAKLDEHRKKRAAQVTQEQFDSRNAKPNSEGALKEFRERAFTARTSLAPQDHMNRIHHEAGTTNQPVLFRVESLVV
ncbi:hypothetical protein PSTG_17595 [Puccinia striiformis f. sp. tritici PST-78]|uniref:Uncharacterized protein n=1 Tax=Puccinia striiformis f. sp. tritici PST-78 TaxID=1165861 RepID=A0A0L0UQC4_9BASI|nr:hypothetical protein PSTG_17595 [Puccinia striiformis f. sp. tritici PST-78]